MKRGSSKGGTDAVQMETGGPGDAFTASICKHTFPSTQQPCHANQTAPDLESLASVAAATLKPIFVRAAVPARALLLLLLLVSGRQTANSNRLGCSRYTGGGAKAGWAFVPALLHAM